MSPRTVRLKKRRPLQSSILLLCLLFTIVITYLIYTPLHSPRDLRQSDMKNENPKGEPHKATLSWDDNGKNVDIWEKPFSSAIFDLHLTTPRNNFKVVRDKLYGEANRDLENIQVLLPNKMKKTYKIYWSRFEEMVPADDDDDTPMPNPGNPNEEDAVPGTVMTLETSDGDLHIMFPLGQIRFPDFDDEFFVVRIIDTQEFWVLYPYELSRRPRRRVFPGTKQVMSIGILSGLFTDDIQLHVKDDGANGDFLVRHALHMNGKVLATRGDRLIDIS